MNYGKENGRVAFDKVKQSYYVYWHDPETGKRKTTTYAKWWWETNIGPIPPGYRAGYRDGNPLNLKEGNICLQTPAEFGQKISKRLQGHGFSDETKQKMSARKKGGKLTDEHKRKIGDASRRAWGKGTFDTVHVGKNNKNWRGGPADGYPSEFVRVRDAILSRDRNTCRVCGNPKGKRLEVHHIDGNRNHNTDDNLLTLCSLCHNRVHSKMTNIDPILLVLRSMLKF